MTLPDFWDKPQESQQTVERLKAVRKVVDPWQAAFRSAQDLSELLGLLDENQEDSLKEMQA